MVRQPPNTTGGEAFDNLRPRPPDTTDHEAETADVYSRMNPIIRACVARLHDRPRRNSCSKVRS
jgi:hypothetical protein